MNDFAGGWDEAQIEAALARGDPAELLHVPILVSLDPPDAAWAEAICFRLAAHADAQVRANAILGYGHLSRTLGALDEARVRPLIEAALRDADARAGQRRNGGERYRVFLGWTFWRRTPTPPCPSSIRVYFVTLGWPSVMKMTGPSVGAR